MRKFLKKIASPFLQKSSAIYLKKRRKYNYKDISVWVEPTVFPPFITISTKLLLEFVDQLSLKDKTLLELGCGCGIISILAAKKDSIVTSTDINPIALSALVENAKENDVTIDIIASDLFENIEENSFDFVIINPPYYPKNPNSIAENAWFCGENFEYFESLFRQLPKFLTPSNSTFMILSVDCELEKIKAIALQNKISFHVVQESKVMGETNFIFKLDLL
jgi:release factor glutamine methyltransferase